jgi:hypothetical protein
MNASRLFAKGTASNAYLARGVPRLSSPLIPPRERRAADPLVTTVEGPEGAMSMLAPVRGVTLELFADIARAVASQRDASTRGSALAASCGIAAEDWRFACRAWNIRIAEDPAVARKLSELYRPDVIDLREQDAS